MLLSGALGASGAELYVATNATPASPFFTWATGFDNPQDAFDYASDGDTIHLAGHTFAGGPALGDSDSMKRRNFPQKFVGPGQNKRKQT